MPRTILVLAIATLALALAPAGRAAAKSPDDGAVAKQIANDLKASGRLQDYRVGVKYENGVAWLMGSVTNKQQSDTAERLALQSAGVDRVVNKLEITGGDSADCVQQAGGVNAEGFQAIPASRPAARPMPVRRAGGNMPVPYARMGGPGGPGGPVQQATFGGMGGPPGMAGGAGMGGGYQPAGYSPTGMAQSASYDNAQMPGYAWPSYASYPNYAAVTYPQQYSPSAWPYIGPFYPYPQVPLGWRKVTLEWDDGWWFLDFKDCKDCH